MQILRWPDAGISFSINLKTRKTFTAWNIPVSIRKTYSIVDTDIVEITFRCGDLELNESHIVTSGGEFNTWKSTADELKSQVSHGATHVEITIRHFWRQSEPYKKIQRQLDHRVAISYHSGQKNRLKRLAEAPKFPGIQVITSTMYIRNEDVVAEALFRAQGKCQRCQQDAPFLRSRDATPFLEVHHIKPLSQGGEDTLENVEALCPNCHRHRHFGPID